MGTRVVTVVGVILIACTVALSARRSYEADGRKAAALVTDGKHKEAGRLYGQLLAGVQKKGDLLAEQSLAKSLFEAYGSVAAKPTSTAIVALMGKLDTKRSGAFVSAHALAGRLVIASTVTGDRSNVPAAAKVLKAHARVRRTGVGAAAMAAYAEGLVLISRGEDEPGSIALGEGLSVMVEQGWSELAAHAAVELAAANVRLAKPRAATAALEQVESLFPATGDVPLAGVLRALLARHLPDAGEEVLAPATRAMELHGGAGSVGAAGGAGGRGDIEQSKVGAALPRFSSKARLVTATRTGEEFEIRQGFDPSFLATQPWSRKVQHHADGGVTLSFYRGSVALAMVDPVGNLGQPGERTSPSPLRAFYPVAKGETWGVTKTGVVTITSR